MVPNDISTAADIHFQYLNTHRKSVKSVRASVHIQLVGNELSWTVQTLTGTHQPVAEYNRICCLERYVGGNFNLSLHRGRCIHPESGAFIFIMLGRLSRVVTLLHRASAYFRRVFSPRRLIDRLGSTTLFAEEIPGPTPMR